MERRFVLEIHINRQLPTTAKAVSVRAEEGIFDENERFVPLVYTFYCDTEKEAKELRDEILSRYPDAIEQIREEVREKVG
jgi:alkanesulfonate monooxygenase SsuD/methylene tetrahydromethanopterin reductase-like flavin-dependent oxidoreductase (luciferase family)